MLAKTVKEDAPVMTAGTGGLTNAAAAKGPVAGFDPVMNFRKHIEKRMKMRIGKKLVK